jgi:hypothetical protein
VISPRWRRWIRYWPETGLTLLLLFFTLRKLGDFPASWADEGLFITVAKMVALGHGYTLPLLGYQWAYPYFLNVGPTLIYPVALSLKLFGISTAAARIPMALYLFAATGAFYAFASAINGRNAARWATLLLITVSAYINTGKPVLGEIPAFFFLLLGLLSLCLPRGWKRDGGAGLAFGLAFLTKITYGLVLPALGIAWIAALWKRDWREVRSLTVVGLLTILVYIPWRVLEMTHTLGGSLMAELHNFLVGKGGDTTSFYILRTHPEELLRLPFLAFTVFLLAGGIGLFFSRRRLGRTLSLTIGTLIALFILYFLNGFGWYRLLLPGHLLLLLFVPTGLHKMMDKRLTAVFLMMICAAQAWWQFTYQGSSNSLEGAEAATYIETHDQQTNLLIAQTEVFARLPDNPHWLFLSPNLSFSLPRQFIQPTPEQCRWPVLLKLSQQDQQKYKPAQLTQVARRYFLIAAPYHCPPTLNE